MSAVVPMKMPVLEIQQPPFTARKTKCFHSKNFWIEASTGEWRALTSIDQIVTALATKKPDHIDRALESVSVSARMTGYSFGWHTMQLVGPGIVNVSFNSLNDASNCLF